MKLDKDLISKLKKGSPLEGLSDKHIEDVTIGEYPLSMSSNQVMSIWRSCVNSDEHDLWVLKYHEVECLLSAMINKTLEHKNNEQYEKVRKIKSFLDQFVYLKSVIHTQAKIIRQQELDLMRLERDRREAIEQRDKWMDDKLL